jgi:hypothetical protein
VINLEKKITGPQCVNGMIKWYDILCITLYFLLFIANAPVIASVKFAVVLLALLD